MTQLAIPTSEDSVKSAERTRRLRALRDLRRRTSSYRTEMARDYRRNCHVMGGAPNAIRTFPTGASWLSLEQSNTDARYYPNIVSPVVITVCNLVESVNPTIGTLPMSPRREDIERAEIRERKLQLDLERRFSIEQRQEWTCGSALHGRSIARIRWDATLGPIAKAGARPGRPEGAQVVDILDHLSLLFDPATPNPETWRACAMEFRVPREAAEAAYGVDIAPDGLGDWRDESVKEAQRAMKRLMPGRMNSGISADDEPLDVEYVTITEYYECDGPENCHSWTVYAGDQFLTSREGGPYDHGMVPFVLLDYFRIPGIASPMGLGAMLATTQARYSINWSQYMDHMDTVSAPYIVTPSGARLRQENALKAYAGRVLVYDGRTPPEIKSGTPATPDFIRVKDELRDEAMFGAGVNPATFGMGMSAENRSGTAISARQHAAGNFVERFVRRYHSAFATVAQQFYGLYAQFGDAESEIRLINPNDVFKATIVGTEIREGRAVRDTLEDVIVKSAPLAPFDKAAQLDQITALYDKGVLGFPQTSPEARGNLVAALRGAGLPVPDVIAATVDPVEQFVRGEETLILQGNGPKDPVTGAPRCCAALMDPQKALSVHSQTLNFLATAKGNPSGKTPTPSVPDALLKELAAHIEQASTLSHAPAAGAGMPPGAPAQGPQGAAP